MKICKDCGTCMDDRINICPNCKAPCNYPTMPSRPPQPARRQGNAAYPSRPMQRQGSAAYPPQPMQRQGNAAYPPRPVQRQESAAYPPRPVQRQGAPAQRGAEGNPPPSPIRQEPVAANAVRAADPTSSASVVNYVINAPATPQTTGSAPAWKLKTNRSLLLYLFLGIITLGIYPIVVLSSISSDINTIAGRHDGKNTTHFCLMLFVFSWLTLGIYPFIWYHQLSARIGDELQRRQIPYSFGAGHFWGWSVCGILLLGIGPFIYCNMLFKSMNLLSADYNMHG